MLVALHPEHVVTGEEGADVVPHVHQGVVALGALDDHFPGFAVFGADQAVVAGDHQVVEFVFIGGHFLLDPLEGDRQVVVLEQDDHHVVADHVVVQVLGAGHVHRILGDVVLHVLDPLHRVGVAVFVVAHQRQELDAGVAVALRHGGPLLEFPGGAVVGEVAHRDHDVHAQLLLFVEHRFHRVHGDVVAAALGVRQQADFQGRGGGGRRGVAVTAAGGAVGTGRIAATAGQRRRQQAGGQRERHFFHVFSP